ncbi:MAG: oligosaccharide flippase family protein [Candidatus Thorarchaeota archaeon]|nr:oligosaccharide flippase family protein [Candidatus Thorarchaeota archaeon]
MRMQSTAVIARGTTLLLVQSLFSGSFRLVNVMLLTRLLPQTEVGRIAVLAIIYGYMQFMGAAGLNHAMPRFVPELEKAGGRALRSLFAASVLVIVFASALLLVAFSALSPALVSSGLLDSNLVFLLYCIAPLSSLGVFSDSFLLARYSVRPLAIGRLVFDTMRMALTVILVILGMGVVGVLLGWLAAELSGLAVFVPFSLRSLPSNEGILRLRPVLAFALPSLLFQTIDVTIQNTDRMVLLQLTDLASLGVYDVILGMLFMLSFVALSLSVSLYPVLTRLEIGNTAGMHEAPVVSAPASLLIRYVLLILLPVSIVLSMNAERTLSLVFGTSYSSFPGASLSFGLVVVFYSLWGVTYALHTILRSMDESHFFWSVGLAVIGVELLVCWSLVQWLGLLGAAVTRCVYISILLSTALTRLKRRGVALQGRLGTTVSRVVPASLVAGAAFYVLSPDTLLSAALTLSLALLLCYALLILTKEPIPLDFVIARHILPKKLHRFLNYIETRQC